MQASFEGQMLRVETTDLLTFVNLARRTGLLELERAGQSTRIFFRLGDPVFASSTRHGLRLGDLLVRASKVSQRDLDRCLARHRAAGDRVGQVLVAERLLTEEELRGYLKVQISEVIFDTFSWTEGRFAFYDDLVHPPDVTTIDMNLQNLLMEGVRRLDERGRLDEAFPDHQALLEKLANPEWVKDKMSLTPLEWSVFFLVDGRRSVHEICQLAGNPDELATLETLNRLRGVNLIALVAPGPPGDVFEEAIAGTVSLHADRSAASILVGLTPDESVPDSPARVPRTDDSASLVSPMAIHYAAASGPSARLMIEPSDPPVSYSLQRDSYTIGRSSKNDIVLQYLSVSVFHARIDRVPNGFTLVDLRSTNGTALNGQRIGEPVLLRPNDLLHLGEIRLRYQEE